MDPILQGAIVAFLGAATGALITYSQVTKKRARTVVNGSVTSASTQRVQVLAEELGNEQRKWREKVDMELFGEGVGVRKRYHDLADLIQNFSSKLELMVQRETDAINTELNNLTEKINNLTVELAKRNKQ